MKFMASEFTCALPNYGNNGSHADLSCLSFRDRCPKLSVLTSRWLSGEHDSEALLFRIGRVPKSDNVAIELIHGNYLIYYRVQERKKVVEILAFKHGAQVTVAKSNRPDTAFGRDHKSFGWVGDDDAARPPAPLCSWCPRLELDPALKLAVSQTQ
jgi:hypothetical protein